MSRVLSLKVVPVKLIAGVIVLSLSLGLSAGASADVSIGGPYNCDSNAVVYCGVSSGNSLIQEYAQGDGRNSSASIDNIYSYFGITASDIQSMPNNDQAGSVTSSGNVYIGSQLVATDALTGGRDFIPGSTAETYNGTSFYTRSPDVSFVSSPLSAYVVMNGNQFEFAILSSCGNPVKATSVAAPASTPVPVTAQTTPPTAAQTSSTPPTPAPTVLPNTGVSLIDTLLIFMAASTLGYLAYLIYTKRRAIPPVYPDD